MNRDLNAPEPAPKPTARRPVWELVIEDMSARDRAGRVKYGVPLQSGNGRDALVDAYQEALDLAVYLRQAIEERDARAAAVRTYRPIRCPHCSREMAVVERGTHATCLSGCGDLRLGGTP
jgi:hypothetical protein